MAEGFLPLIILWIIFGMISKISKANKETKKNAEKIGTSARARTVRTQQPSASPAPAREAAPATPTLHTLTPQLEAHHSAPFEAHMHEPVMGEEGVGTEGIDCCHDFMLSDPNAQESADFLSMTEADEAERARALLQGVIFSEILGRRTNRRYGGRPS